MSSDYQSYMAEYCEWCGTLESAKSDDVDGSLADELEEPVARVDVLEAIADLAPQDLAPLAVGETVATEQGPCEHCEDGQMVKRYYSTGDVPEPEYDPDPEEYTGRDPEEDSLLIDDAGAFGEEGAAHDVNDLAAGDSDG